MTASHNFKSGLQSGMTTSHYLEECFEKRHVLEKTLFETEKLLLKHMYDSVSLLNDISRNVDNIDYTRDMSREEYFCILYDFSDFYGFYRFYIFLFSFCHELCTKDM